MQTQHGPLHMAGSCACGFHLRLQTDTLVGVHHRPITLLQTNTTTNLPWLLKAMLLQTDTQVGLHWLLPLTMLLQTEMAMHVPLKLHQMLQANTAAAVALVAAHPRLPHLNQAEVCIATVPPFLTCHVICRNLCILSVT